MRVIRCSVGLVGVIALTVLAVGPAGAQDKPLRRYKPVTVSYDVKGADDPGLASLIEQLRAAATAKNVAVIREAAAPDLVVLTPPVGFPAAGTPRAMKLEPALPGPERLDKALALLAHGEGEPDRKALDGLLLMTVTEALAKGTPSRSRQVKNAFCAPAEPRFDRGQVLAIAEAADEVPDNLVILGEETAFLAKPDAAAPAAATLKPGTVVPFVEGAVEGADGKRDWYAVGLPNGTRGYAKGDRTLSFEATRLCFTKAGKGAEAKWSLSAVVVPSLSQ